MAWSVGGSPTTHADVADVVAALRGKALHVFNVKDYGAVGDGTTNDTVGIQAAIDAAVAAGGGEVFFPRGVFVVSGALQDTGGANAQLVLPAVDYVDTEQITVTFRGVLAPGQIASVVGDTPIPDNHSVIKSTLTSGSGGALLGGVGPVGTLESFTNITVCLYNLTFRMPANPTHSALNLSKVAALDVDNVTVDAGSYYVGGLAEPSTSSSYGLRVPGNNNGAYTRLGTVLVVGLYNGYEFAEHVNGYQVNAFGCRRAAIFLSTNHASHIQRFMAVHCQRGLVWTGLHFVTIDQFDLEKATSGWFVPVADIDDSSNTAARGTLRYHIVTAGVGPGGSLVRNGGAALFCLKPYHSFFAGVSSGTPTLSATTHTAVAMGTDLVDSDAFHSTSSNTDRVVIAEAGWYRFSAVACFAAGTGWRLAAIWKNGVGSGTRMAAAQATANSADQLILNVHSLGPMYLEPADYLSIGLYASVSGDYVGAETKMSMERVG